MRRAWLQQRRRSFAGHDLHTAQSTAQTRRSFTVFTLFHHKFPNADLNVKTASVLFELCIVNSPPKKRNYFTVILGGFPELKVINFSLLVTESTRPPAPRVNFCIY